MTMLSHLTPLTLDLLDHLEPSELQTPRGTISIRLQRPGLILIRLQGLLDTEMTQLLCDWLDQSYSRLMCENRRAYLVFDCDQIERLTLPAQHIVLKRRDLSTSPAQVLGYHAVISQPVLLYVVRLLQRMQPGSRERLIVHQSLEQALSQVQQHLQRPTGSLLGPELEAERFESAHTCLRYFQPDPRILLCQGEGITNAEAATHMIAVHARHMAAQRRSFGKAVLIMDSRRQRHCTIEAYRLMRSNSQATALQPEDAVIVISPHWPKAVSRLVKALLPNLSFQLEVVGSLDEALACAWRLNQARSPVRRSRKGKRWRWPWAVIREQAAEIRRLKQERDTYLNEAGRLIDDILLYKQPEEMYQIPGRELQGPYHEFYESLYMLQHEYTEYLESLQREIDERILAEHKAAELSQIKSRFLANVSHELRTPLNAIIGFTKLMLKGKSGQLSEQQRLYLERVHDNSRHLLALIDDVLDISKIEAGTVRLRQTAIETAHFLEQVLEPLQLVAQHKQLFLTLAIDPALPRLLYVDADRLRQIVSNLVGNALKFTETGGVTLRLRAGSGSHPLVLEVVDSGIGISRQDQGKIFEAFIQAHDGSYAGARLGLSICHSLARLMNCRLEVDSEPGQGSIFRLYLPAECLNAQA